MLYRVDTSSSYELVGTLRTILQKKQKKGGQSAQRIGRLREEKYNATVKSIAALIVDTYTTANKSAFTVKGLLVVGPAEMKTKVVLNASMQQYFGDKSQCPVLKTLSCRSINKGTIHEVLKQHIGVIDKVCAERERAHISKLVGMVRNESKKLLFGEREVTAAMTQCTVKCVYIGKGATAKSIDALKALNTYGAQFTILKADITNTFASPFVGVKFY